MPRYLHFTPLDSARPLDEVRTFCDERFGVDQWAISSASGHSVLCLPSYEAYAVAKAELGARLPVVASPLAAEPDDTVDDMIDMAEGGPETEEVP